MRRRVFEPVRDRVAAPRVHRKRQVLTLTGLSATTLWRLVRRGAFPAPIQLSPGAVGWLDAEVTAWLSERAGAREGRPPTAA